jgi:hypothetical protein
MRDRAIAVVGEIAGRRILCKKRVAKANKKTKNNKRLEKRRVGRFMCFFQEAK